MLKKIIEIFINDPLRLPVHIFSMLYFFVVSQNKSIKLDGKIKVIGIPIIDIRNGSRLHIGSGVTLNSRNKGYHINMHSPVKLFADRSNAEIWIGNGTRIHGSCIHAYQSIRIGNNCLIAANCQIFDGNGHDLSFPHVEERINTIGSSKPIVIEDNVWIGANSIILPGVRIGYGSVISANSVVTKDVPQLTLAGGNPALIIKSYSDLKS